MLNAFQTISYVQNWQHPSSHNLEIERNSRIRVSFFISLSLVYWLKKRIFDTSWPYLAKFVQHYALQIQIGFFNMKLANFFIKSANTVKSQALFALAVS